MPFERPPHPHLPPEASEHQPSDIPTELAPYVPEAQQFIEDHQEIFHAIAGDRSITYKIGNGFVIDLKAGEVTLDVRDWQWAKEKGLSQWQILWSVCHEIGHYRDLREAPEDMLKNFEYLEGRARQLAPPVLEIWREKSGGTLPDYLTADVAQTFVYQRLHLLYNCLDDIYDNQTIGLRSGIFSPTGSQAPEVERLYRDYLFPTRPKEIGNPPQIQEAADYEQLPKSYQLAYALLRRQMVPDQAVLISPSVQTKLQGFSDAAAQRLNITLEKEVASATTPANRKARNPSWRYQRIKQAAEPAFVELLLQDLREMPVPQSPQGKPMPGTGETQPADPWQPLDDKPEPIDLDTIRDFIKQSKEKNQDNQAAAKEAEAKARLTPQAKAEKAQSKADQKICEQYNVDPKLANEYRNVEKSIEPYKEELAAVFEEVMNTISLRVSTFWAEGFRSGRFNVDRFIRKYSPEIAVGRPDLIAWNTLDVHDQREITSRLMLFPDRLRARLVLDGSGSMNEERILALKQLSVLFLEALSTFEATVNLRFRLKEPLRVDTEIHMFGSPGRSQIVKTFAADKLTDKIERADRFKAFGKINNSYGDTCDAEPFWNIAQSLDPALVADLKANRAKEFVFEITDGGANKTSAAAQSGETPEQDTRHAIASVAGAGAITRGFQIGNPSREEEVIFDGIWGETGSHVAHPKDLAATVARLLAEQLRQTQFQVQYYEADEAEA